MLPLLLFYPRPGCSVLSLAMCGWCFLLLLISSPTGATKVNIPLRGGLPLPLKLPHVFVVMEGPRVGSGFLIQLVNRCPHVFVTKEVLIFSRLKEAISERESLKKWLFRVYRELGKENRQIESVGMKTQWLDLRPHTEFFRDVDKRVIFLYRNNRVKQVISMCNAQTSGHFHARVRSEIPSKVQCSVTDLHELLHSLHNQSAGSWSALYESDFFSTAKLLMVPYEVLSADPQKAVNSIFRFLGYEAACAMDEADIQKTYYKQVGDDLEDVLDNYDELYTSLEGTPFQNQMRRDWNGVSSFLDVSRLRNATFV